MILASHKGFPIEVRCSLGLAIKLGAIPHDGNPNGTYILVHAEGRQYIWRLEAGAEKR